MTPPVLLVENALEPTQYRVYPDTPLTEILGLMVRRGIHAVPVVGEQFEVLGIITSGDALSWVLSGRPGEARERMASGVEDLKARDVMTRTVLCVSEDQPLVEAAQMMVNRDVEQLPVVRDGEFIGFVTRDSILRSLMERDAGNETEHDNENDEDE